MNHEEPRSASPWRRRAAKLLVAVVALSTTISMFGQAPLASAQVEPSPSAPAPSPSEGNEDVVTDPSTEPTPSETITPEPSPSETIVEPSEDPAETPEPTTAPTQRPQNQQRVEVAPMAVGPDGGTAPYVFWDTRDENGVLRGGATYQLQGPRTSSSFLGWETGVSWNTSITVADCTSAPCAGPDLDPDPGEFLVQQIGTHRISDSSRYRVQQDTPPTGYTFTAATSWQAIPGTRNTPTGWSQRTYEFGDFRVRAIPPMAPTCAAGWVYGVSSAGQLRQVPPTGPVTNLGSSADTTNFNGLGIGPGGQTVYGIQRSASGGTAQNAIVWTYNTTTGNWTNTNASTANIGGDSNTGTNMVGGAVNLSNGLYYFGGFTSNGNFKIYQYNPTATPRITHKVTVTTAETTSANGDIAFNSDGDLFVVHGTDGGQTTIYSVTAANFNAANGTAVQAARSASFGTMGGVNGVAFDSNGRAYLGSGSELRSYAMPNWSDPQNRVESGLNSTDLASCSSPATITIEKVVQGGRIAGSDQFVLSLTQGATSLGTATTSGNQTGVQGQRIGPLPTARNVTLSFSESASGTTNLSNYASSWSCTVDGEAIAGASGTGTMGSVTIPNSGDQIVCRITNAPLVADVTVSKTVVNSVGENPQPGVGWTMRADRTATAGTVTSTPTGVTQITNPQGDARWSYRFNGTSARATVTIGETQQPGFQFVEGACLITSLNGDTRGVNLTGVSGNQLTDIAPGDSVECMLVNQPAPGRLAIVKTLDSSVPQGSGNIQFTGNYTCRIAGNVVASGTWAITGPGAAILTPAQGSPAANAIPSGAQCSVTETQPSGNGGLPNASWRWGPYTVTGPVTIESGTAKQITVTNRAERVYGAFSVGKLVVGTADGGNRYSGVWSCSLGTETVTGTWGPIADGGTWTSTANHRVPLGAQCSVTNEADPGPPVAGDPSYGWSANSPTFSAAVTAVSLGATSPTPKVTVTNISVRTLGSVTWLKVDEGENALGSSEWTLTGPTSFNGGQPLVIQDCVASGCAGPDTNPAVGAFTIMNLTWGDYTLSETRPPAGYYPHSDVTFTVDASTLDITLDPIVNSRIDGPDLPFTGGLSRDAFLITGASILLLGMAAAVTLQLRRRRKEVA